VLVTEKDRLVVAAGRGAVRLLTVQTPGKRPLPAVEFLRGHHVFPGDRMGVAED
jgi:methionyl-tRNA formyltransferase